MKLSRRHLLIAAAAVGLGGSVNAAADLVWTGTALGADAEIRIAGQDRKMAEALVRRALAEIERLERVFSLYRPESELSRLNRDGVLDHPSQDFRLLLERSLELHQLTEGAFNVAIQPVWRFLARHFSVTQSPPERADLSKLLQSCDAGQVSVSASRIALRPGMALTFNGIAQGYITDAVADLFRREGLGNMLIALGEIRALPGRAWAVAVEGRAESLRLSDGAVAQSAGRGTPFTADGRWHHLIDPASGASANAFAAVTVRAPSATLADALSTALFTTPLNRQQRIASRFAEVQVEREPVT